MLLKMRFLTGFGLSLLLASFGAAEDDFRDLYRRLPESANTVVAINVKAIRAQEGKPVGPDATGYEIIAGAIVSPEVDLILYATHLDPESVDTRRTGGVFRLNRTVTLHDVAERTDGEIIDLDGEKIVYSRRRGYLVELDDHTLGMARQTTRQELARWLQFARTNKSIALPKYLAQVLETNKAPIVGVLDLANMFDAKSGRDRLLLVEALGRSSKAEIDTVARLLGGLKGLVLSVHGTALNQAELRLDFSAAVGRRGELFKAILLEALDDFGAALTEFRNATVAVDGSCVRLRTNLSDDSLIRIMSLFMPPTPAAKPDASSSSVPRADMNLDATRRYFHAVRKALDDLQRKGKRDADYLRNATWLDSSAKKIEQLPTRYVDAEVVKFGEATAAKLRTIALSLRGVIVEVSALESGTLNVGYYIPGWGFSSGGLHVDSNLAQIRARQAEIVRKDASRRLELWDSIEQNQRVVVKSIRERLGLDLEKAMP